MNLISNSLGFVMLSLSNLKGTIGSFAFISTLFDMLSIIITCDNILNKLDLPEAFAPYIATLFNIFLSPITT